MNTTDRVHTDPDAAASVIDAATRLIGTYSIGIEDPSMGDVIAHLYAIYEDIHTLSRALAVFRIATDPPPADPALDDYSAEYAPA